jgi:hypothetical protein
MGTYPPTENPESVHFLESCAQIYTPELCCDVLTQPIPLQVRACIVKANKTHCMYAQLQTSFLMLFDVLAVRQPGAEWDENITTVRLSSLTVALEE